MILIIPILIVFILVILMLYYKKKDRKKYYTPFKTAFSISIFLFALFISFYTKKLTNNYPFYIILGLFFSILGDFFLSIEEKYFIYGVISFFITHIFYIIAFLNIKFSFNLYLLSILLFIGITTYLMMFKNLGNLKLPILLYTFIIIIMLYFSLMILLSSNFGYLFRYTLFSGALLFFISDSILSTNKYMFKIRYRDYLVGLTYFIGQILIAISIFYL